MVIWRMAADSLFGYLAPRGTLLQNSFLGEIR